MKKNFWLLAILVGMFFGLSGFAFAEADRKDLSGCEGNEIIIATGLKTAAYSQIMNTVINLDPNLACEYTASSGGLDNILALIRRDVDAGLAQADVIEFLSKTDPIVQKKIRSLVALHTNYVHIFVNKNGFTEAKSHLQKLMKTGDIVVINDLRDLRGRTVATHGSAPITMRIINDRLRLDMNIVEVNKKEEGFEMLKSGQAHAFVAMGGKPIPWAEKEVDGNLFTLANVNPADVQVLGKPYFPGKLTYKKLGVVGINSVGVRNDLVVWDFSGKRAEQLVQIRNLIKENLEDIKDARGSHPGWQDVELNTLDDVSWQPYKAPVGTAHKKK